MGKRLTDDQILILNNLIYFENFSEPALDSNSLRKKDLITVIDILNEIKIPEEQLNSKTGKMEPYTKVTMTKSDCDEILEIAKKDEDIRSMIVTNRLYKKRVEDGRGDRKACFLDPKDNNQAYVVFRGTGEQEWRDNFEGGKEADTQAQIDAKKWLEETGYKDVIISGHSKGANKAKYCTITTDLVSECISFDGQGFSNEFVEKYKDEIAKKRDKIHNYANYRDYVNILLNNISPANTIFIYNDDDVHGYGGYHAPNALFARDENGKMTNHMGKHVEISIFSKMCHDFTLYLTSKATPAERAAALSFFGELATQFIADNGDVREDINSIFKMEGADILVRYLHKFLEDTKNSDEEKYKEYLKGIDEFGERLTDTKPEDRKVGKIEKFLKRKESPFYVFTLFDKGDWFAFSAWLFSHDFPIFLKMNPLFMMIISKFRGSLKGKERDFTLETKGKLLKAVDEVKGEKWWDISKWDCWYRFEKLFGNLELFNYTARSDDYYRKIVDVDGSSKEKIEQIFIDANNTDVKFANDIEEEKNKLSDIADTLEKIRNEINTTISV